MTVKKFIIAACTLVLSGCAAQKQAMPLSYYDDISYRDVSADQCVSLGFMDYQTAAAAKNFSDQDLNNWIYDPMLYQKVHTDSAKRIDAKPLQKKDCDRLAISVAQRQLRDKQDYQERQLAVQQQQASSQSIMAMENARPKTTYCHKHGDKTVCNTY